MGGFLELAYLTLGWGVVLVLVMVHVLKHYVFAPPLQFLEVSLFFCAVMMGRIVMIYPNLERVVHFVRDYLSFAEVLFRYQIHL